MADRFVIVIKDINLVSTNEAYRPTYKGKYAFFRRSKELITFQREFSKKLETYRESFDLFIETQKQNISNLGLKLNLVLELPYYMFFYKTKQNDIRKHDTSNYIKSIEDQISAFTGIDDKFNIQVSATKTYNESALTPNVYVLIECIDYKKYHSKAVLDYFNIGEK
jgi:Holliday junction resolvase RusA-like endonuclease